LSLTCSAFTILEAAGKLSEVNTLDLQVLGLLCAWSVLLSHLTVHNIQPENYAPCQNGLTYRPM
jgi:hypothetical protein